MVTYFDISSITEDDTKAELEAEEPKEQEDIGKAISQVNADVNRKKDPAEGLTTRQPTES